MSQLSPLLLRVGIFFDFVCEDVLFEWGSCAAA
jgi:hypothetical protein